MSLVWSPERASKAYLDTIQTCGISSKTSAAEFLSAMAAGYNAKLIVEAWKKHENGYNISNITTSIGLAIAAKHMHGRHVCIVKDEASRIEHVNSMKKLSAHVTLPEVVVVGEVEVLKNELNKIDFLVVDGSKKDFARALSSVKLNQNGAILACKRNSTRLSWWKEAILDAKVISHVREITLPFRNIVLEIAYIASNREGNLKSRKYSKRWVRHVDQESGEEHVFRR